MAAPPAGGLFTDDGEQGKKDGAPKKLAVLTSGGDSAGSELSTCCLEEKRDLNQRLGRADACNSMAIQ